MDIREMIDGVNDRPTEVCHVPQWGIDVTLRKPSIGDAEKMHAMMQHASDTHTMNVMHVSTYIVDDKGARAFTTDEDLKILNDKSFDAINHIVKHINVMCNITEADIEKAMDDLDENPTPFT